MSNRGKRVVVTRLWHLVLVLHQARQPRSIARLMEELGVSRPTLYRDLATLERAHVALERVTVNGEARVGLVGLRTLAVAPSPLQVAALRLAREALAPLDGTALLRELDELLAQWSHVESTAPLVSQRLPVTDRSALVAVLDAAMTGHRRIVLEYQVHATEHVYARPKADRPMPGACRRRVGVPLTSPPPGASVSSSSVAPTPFDPSVAPSRDHRRSAAGEARSAAGGDRRGAGRTSLGGGWRSAGGGWRSAGGGWRSAGGG